MFDYEIDCYDLASNSIQRFTTNIEEPRQCMHCQHAGIQTLVSCVGTQARGDKASAIALFSCTVCGATSVHFMDIKTKHNPDTFEKFDCLSSTETLPKQDAAKTTFPQYIVEDFSEFHKIFSQSEQAEAQQLNQLASVGYRRALEFLVSDYLTKYAVEGVTLEWLTSSKTTLRDKIQKIQSTRIQKLAQAMAYLDNDNGYYSEQHPEHESESLKLFTRALVSDIENELIFQEAEKLFNSNHG